MQDDYRDIVEALGPDNQAFAGKTVLLTGSQGFLGRLFRAYFDFLNREVLSAPMDVICLDITSGPFNSSYPHESHYGDDISSDRGWFDSHLDWESSKGRHPDYLLNLAGRASPKAYSEAPLETIDVSVDGTKHMLRLAIKYGIKTYLGCSSSEIYGNPTVIPTPESYLGGVDAFCERGCYDVSKLQLESLCYVYNTRHNVNTKVIRPFNVVGPLKGSDGRVIPAQVERLLKGEKMKVYLPGDQTRTFCWWSDFVVGTIKVLLHGDNRPYNLGNPANTISMLDLARKLEVIAGRENAIELIPTSAVYATEPMRRVPDITRARQLGYEPKVTLDEALKRFWEWAQANYPKS